MFKDPRFQQALGVFDAADLRSKLVGAAPGDLVELREQEHALMAAVLANPPPGLFNPALFYSPDGVDFARDIVKAPTTKPEAA